MDTIRLEIYSDYICPWCFIAKMRMKRIQEKLKDRIPLSISTQAYLLYPFIPKGGMPKSAFAKKTKPGMGSALKQAAKEENIQINYKVIERIPNSLEAHRLTYLLAADPLKMQLSEAIFKAYFQEGANIEDKDLLAALALKLNAPKEIIQSFLETETGMEACMNSIQKAKEASISLVPSINIDHKVILPGLQSEETMINFIQKAAQLKGIL